MEVFVGGKFRVGPKIGRGSFGVVHIGTNVETGEEVAIKLETIQSKCPKLLYESKVYKLLAGGVGIPSVHWYGVEGAYNVMVLDLLGPCLEDLFNACNRWFSWKTVLMLASQIINRVEYVHAKGFVHRDIKPRNLLIGRGKNSSQICVIDFGLANRYRHPDTKEHYPFRKRLGMTGTATFASINTHLGFEQSRRDDLEAVGYVLMYFSRTSLPWCGLKGNSKVETFAKIGQSKISTQLGDLCRDSPSEFMTYMNYCRSLGFESTPDYAYLRELIQDMFLLEGYRCDFLFDWRLQRRLATDSTSDSFGTERLPI